MEFFDVCCFECDWEIMYVLYNLFNVKYVFIILNLVGNFRVFDFFCDYRFFIF